MTRTTKYSIVVTLVITLVFIFTVVRVYESPAHVASKPLISIGGEEESLRQRIVELENRISSFDQQLTALVTKLDENNIVSLDGKPNATTSSAYESDSDEPIESIENGAISFYDQVESSVETNVETSTTASSYHQTTLNKLALEVGAPELVEPLLQAINNPNLSNQSAAIEYSDANCSVNRCVFMANMSDSVFSTERMATDDSMEVKDNYRKYLNDLTSSISNQFDHDSQVVSYRKGDIVSFQVIPKGTRRSNGDR